jgi:hypothetical protein
LFDLAAAGQSDEARQIAEHLDRLSEGGFELVSFVEKYAAKP